jgi:hypothetical protein
MTATRTQVHTDGTAIAVRYEYLGGRVKVGRQIRDLCSKPLDDTRYAHALWRFEQGACETCCDQATRRACVASFDCPVHGVTCVRRRRRRPA